MPARLGSICSASLFVAAAKLGKRTGLAAEIFYGFAREKLPTTLNLLLAQSTDTQRRALETWLDCSSLYTITRESLG